MTAFIAELTYAETFYLVGKYSLGAVSIAPVYFFTNELITTQFLKIGINNYYMSNSISAGICMPLFGAFNCNNKLDYFRRLNFKESKNLAYRYMGTLCCGSLIFDFLLSCIKNSALGRISLDNLTNSKRNGSTAREYGT